MEVKMLLVPSMMETERLILRDVILSECQEVQEIYETGSYLKNTTGDTFDGNHIYQCLTEGDLPPIENANRAHYALKCIRTKENDRLIGLFDLYHGYPHEKTVWISYFYIHPSYQKQGLGGEAIEYLCLEAGRKNYNKVALGVALKNWNAIRFWVNNGFKGVMGVYGDKEFSPENMAVLGLERPLL